MPEYYGIYRGSVYDIRDPDSHGRLRLLIPQVLGESPSGWAEPSLPPAADYNPVVGDRVWVFFEGGDMNRAVYIAKFGVTADVIVPGTIQEAIDHEPDILLPITSDGLGPTQAPLLDAKGTTQGISARVDGVVNRDPVEYEYHISTDEAHVFVPGDVTTRVHKGPETSFTIRTLADGITTLLAGLNYAVAVFAWDTLDNIYSPGSTPVITSPRRITDADIVVDQGWFNFIGVDEIEGYRMKADIFMGAKFTTRSGGTGSGQEFGPVGANWFNAIDPSPVVSIPSNISVQNPAYWKGRGEFQELEATNGISMRGPSFLAKASSLTLGSKLQPPATGPTYSIDWEAPVTFTGYPWNWDPTKVFTITWDATNSRWLIGYSNNDSVGQILHFNAAGVYQGNLGAPFQPYTVMYGGKVVRIGTTNYHLTEYGTEGGSYYLDVSPDFGFPLTEHFGWGSRRGATLNKQTPYFSTDGTNVLITEFVPDTDVVPSVGKVVVVTWTPGTAQGAELIPNPGAETNTTGWSGWVSNATSVITRTTTAGNFHSGVAGFACSASVAAYEVGMKTTPAGTSAYPVIKGQRYEMTAWVKCTAANRVAWLESDYFYESGAQDGGSGASTTLAANTWTQITRTITALVDGFMQVAVTVRHADGVTALGANEQFYIDDVSLKKTAGLQPTNVWKSQTMAVTSGIGGPITGLVISAADFGATRYTVSQAGSQKINWVFDSTGAYYTDSSFPPVDTVAVKGLIWKETSPGVGNFYTYGLDGKMYKYEPTTWDWTKSGAWHVAPTWQNLPMLFETALGSETLVEMKKRARLNLTSGTVPNDPEDPNDPEGVGWYIGRAPRVKITSQSRSGTTITYTTNVAHGFSANTVVTISASSTTLLITGDAVTVLSAPTSTTFTVKDAVSGTVAATTVDGRASRRYLTRTEFAYQSGTIPAVGSTTASLVLSTPNFDGTVNAITGLIVPSDPSVVHAWDFPASTPGTIKSEAVRTSGLSKLALGGDGVLARLDPLLPVGFLLVTSAPKTPEGGFLLADGSAVSRTTYLDLEEYYRLTDGPPRTYVWGAGDGSTTFNLPDYRDRYILGAGTRALGSNDGLAFGAARINRLAHPIGSTNLGQVSDVTLGGAGIRLRQPDPHTHTAPGEHPYATAWVWVKH